MSTIAGRYRAVVINLTEVSYLASMGIRTLVLTARSIASKGGRVACFGPSHDVTRVLETAGVTSILPILTDLVSASAAVAP